MKLLIPTNDVLFILKTQRSKYFVLQNNNNNKKTFNVVKIEPIRNEQTVE